MAIISGFRGVRYNSKKINSYDLVLAPPYDVISEAEREILHEKSPFNVIRLILSKGDGDKKYTLASDTFKKWINDEILIRDKESTIYPYFQTFKDGGKELTRKGFIAIVKLEDFSNNIIFPHEKTFSKPKEDRLKLISASNTNFSPVFSVYSDPDSEILKDIEFNLPDKPLFESRDKDGVINYFWTISNKELIDRISEKFKSKQLLIADGHHRYETALNYRDINRKSITGNRTGDEPFEYVMMCLCSAEQSGLIVKPTHRLVGNLNTKQVDALQNLLSSKFISEQSDLDAGNIKLESSEFGLISNRLDNFVKIKDTKAHEFKDELAVINLHKYLLDDLLEDTGIAVKHTKSLDDVLECLNSGSYQFGFVLPEINPVDILKIARENRKLPQKTTYFYPKALSGLVFNKLD